jgi:hypothetical protein
MTYHAKGGLLGFIEFVGLLELIGLLEFIGLLELIGLLEFIGFKPLSSCYAVLPFCSVAVN